ncbi:hypothetical protein [Bdellovibrio sp. NC01]|uniref:hypothetical protein n=1 Tax=Bdellovibrio sp. NC01 TaxID=2220073 RepID=UPI001157C510|nr:hypothetical protein [Bdellovibrio sp. NC01]QDK38651.1 hypothetical protein DOE51_14195 [Bdellovibrio sp. NC01]
MKATVLALAALISGVQAQAGDLKCSGKTDAKRPLFVDVTGEGPAADGSIYQLAFTVTKNGGNVIRNWPGTKTFKPGAVQNSYAYFQIQQKDEQYIVGLAIPVSGNGNAEVRLQDVNTKELIASIPMQCSATSGMTYRQMNDLCEAVAAKAAEKETHKEDKEASLGDVTIVDKDGNEIQANEGFTGIYNYEYSVNEECLDGIQIETKLKKDKNGKMTCEVISTQGIGQRDCG